MPTPHLTDYLTRLQRDASSLVPCQHPECAAYRLSLIELIGIVQRLIGDESPGSTPIIAQDPLLALGATKKKIAFRGSIPVGEHARFKIGPPPEGEKEGVNWDEPTT